MVEETGAAAVEFLKGAALIFEEPPVDIGIDTGIEAPVGRAMELAGVDPFCEEDLPDCIGRLVFPGAALEVSTSFVLAGACIIGCVPFVDAGAKELEPALDPPDRAGAVLLPGRLCARPAVATGTAAAAVPFMGGFCIDIVEFANGLLAGAPVANAAFSGIVASAIDVGSPPVALLAFAFCAGPAAGLPALLALTGAGCFIEVLSCDDAPIDMDACPLLAADRDMDACALLADD